MPEFDLSSLNLVYDPSKSRSDQPVDVKKIKRPAFHENTRRHMYDNAVSLTIEEGAAAREDMLMTTCISCGQPGEVADMHLGHIIGWRTYLQEKHVKTKREAIAAYNDLNNLGREHCCCNTSHRFEGIEKPHHNGKAIFEELVEKFKTENGKDAIDHPISNNVTVKLAEPIVKHSSQARVDIDAMKRPSWDKNTRGGLIKIWEDNRMIDKSHVVNSSSRISEALFRCASCKNFGLGYNMQIGHKVNWREYLEEVDVQTVADAQYAYNDLNNLQFEHAKCNQGHEWEEYDTDNSEFSMAMDDINVYADNDLGFIVPNTKEELQEYFAEGGIKDQLRDVIEEMNEQGIAAVNAPLWCSLRKTVPRGLAFTESTTRPIARGCKFPSAMGYF